MAGPAGVRRSDRSTSIALSYVLVLGISTVLIAGLLAGGATFVENNREQVAESELTVIGSHIAGNMEQVDRMVLAGGATVGEDPAVAYVNQTFQREATGSPYTVELVDGDPPQLVLTATEFDVTVRVNATVQTDVDAGSSSTGGAVSVFYDSDDGLVIDDA